MHSRNGIYGMWGLRSLRLDVGRPDHLAPLLGFGSDELAEIGGRAGKYRTVFRASLTGVQKKSASPTRRKGAMITGE